MMDEQPPAAANSAPILKPLPASNVPKTPSFAAPALPDRQISGGNDDAELDLSVSYTDKVDKKQEDSAEGQDSESDDDNEGADR